LLGEGLGTLRRRGDGDAELVLGGERPRGENDGGGLLGGEPGFVLVGEDEEVLELLLLVFFGLVERLRPLFELEVGRVVVLQAVLVRLRQRLRGRPARLLQLLVLLQNHVLPQFWQQVRQVRHVQAQPLLLLLRRLPALCALVLRPRLLVLHLVQLLHETLHRLLQLPVVPRPDQVEDIGVEKNSSCFRLKEYFIFLLD